ncbi:ribonuclease H [Senna tora]|uniref:Ribonuclease H n=1 Tax=Senna tora TaxID=362788 RepID=A0A835C5B7_9FABA|nr:ribonuclease H [Senna tora]
MRAQNDAFMKKLGWGLINQRESLWVRVLRNTYKCGDDTVPILIKGSNPSWLWKGVVDNWKHGHNGLIWFIGNRNNVRFWSDSWLDISKPLEGCRFWSHPSSIVPPNADRRNEAMAWSLSRDGSFSTKTAYHCIMNQRDSSYSSLWRAIWRWQGMERIHMFLWLCGHNKLLTNDARKRRNMSKCDTRPVCKSGKEDIMHALCDCKEVKPVWLRLVNPGKWHVFFNTPHPNWFKMNLRSKLDKREEDWHSTFASSCWYLWKRRNAVVFEQQDITNVDPVLTILHMVKSHQNACTTIFPIKKVIPQRENRPIARKKLENRLMKINVDGARSEVQRNAACGGVARDKEGNFFAGFMRKLGDCNILTAKLWGIAGGLEMAWKLGYSKVILEADSLTTVNMLGQTIDDIHHCANLIKWIRSWIRKDWEVRIEHNYREGNRAADDVAARALSISSDLVIFYNQHKSLVKIVTEDKQGICSPRSVVV